MSQEVDETNLEINYTYDNRGNISTITNGNVTYTYKYTPFGDLKSISVGSTSLIAYLYISNQDRQANKLIYANGHTVNYNYDSDGMITSVVYKDNNDNVTDTITYVNDETGETIKTIDSENATVTLTYLEQTQIWNANETEILYLYSSDDDSFDEFVNGTKFTTTYSETDDTDTKTSLTTTETTAFGDMTKTVYLDAFGRVIKEETKNGDTVVLTKEYTYNSNGDYVTDQILTEKVTVGSTTYLYNQYSYDNNGNITAIKDVQSSSVQGTYEYDELGQLIKENSTSFEYDNYGNITKKGIYSYSYNDTNWKDRLTSRGNKTITYDESGNPLNYLDAALTWKTGRELASYSKGTLNVTYDYNESALRIKKTVNSNGTITTYNYTWTEDKLTHQAWGNCYLHFYYDYNDEIVGFEYFDGTTTKYYTYLKNMQGDVFGIVDEDGSVVAQYTYDAWGRLKSVPSGIGLINPIRYRGYYYDDEINMYYLQSRYYDPAVGRFINADDVAVLDYTGFTINSNLFTYCDNDSVNYTDPIGFWEWRGRKEAICEPGDTLRSLAKAITGKKSNWKLLSDKDKKKKLIPGKKINILPLLYIWYQNQIKKNCSNSKNAYTASFDGKKLKINVAVVFHKFNYFVDRKLMNMAVNGIKDWSGTYNNVLGKNKVKVIVNVQYSNIDKDVEYSGFVNIFLNENSQETNSPHTSWSTPNTNKSKYKIVLYSNWDNFANTARHEFGHCLGLDDAYRIDENDRAYNAHGLPDAMAMRHDGEPISQEISMIIVGLAENKNQHFKTFSKSEPISNALKFYY